MLRAVNGPSPATVARPPRRTAGAALVVVVLVIALVGTLAIVRDARTTSPVMSVPSASPMQAAATAQIAAHDVLAFVPSGATASIAQAIAQATQSPAAALSAHTRVERLTGGDWAIQVTAPVEWSRLLRAGYIFTGVAPGASNARTGTVDVTTSTLMYVVHMNPHTRLAVFSFRLARDGDTLSTMNWNASTVVSQTSVGNDLP